MIHSVHSCFHTIYLAFSNSNSLTTLAFFPLKISLLVLLELIKQIRFFFSAKFNQKPIKRTCWWREPIFMLYLKQQKNDTKAFLVCYRLFFFFFFLFFFFFFSQCFPFCVLFFFFFFLRFLDFFFFFSTRSQPLLFFFFFFDEVGF